LCLYLLNIFMLSVGEFLYYSCSLISQIFVNEDTVKVVLKGHLWDKKKWSYKTGDLLKEVQFI